MKEKTKAPKKGAPKEQSSEIATISLDTFTVTQEKLEEFLRSFTNLVITPETLPDVKKSLASIKQMRYDIQNEMKANDKNRIEWNTRFMNSNKSKGEKLIEMITPIEEPIAAKVKEIEDVQKAEKEKEANARREAIAARTKQITDTGAIPQDGGYVIADQYISAVEIETLPDTTFNKVLQVFTEKAEQIAAEKVLEEKKAALIAERTNELYEIGMLRGQSGFVMPFQSSTAMTDEMLPKLNSGEWSEFMLAVKSGMADQAKKDQDLKEQQDKFKKDQEALEKEKEEIAAQKKAQLDERTAGRKQHLKDLGFIQYGNAMKFATISVFDELIISATPDEWKQILFDKTAEVTAIKEEHARIDGLNKCIKVAQEKGFELKDEGNGKVLVKGGFAIPLKAFDHNLNEFDNLLATAENEIKLKEEKRIAALLPDKEKILQYADALLAVEVPNNMKSDEGHTIVTSFAGGLQDLVHKFKEKLK